MVATDEIQDAPPQTPPPDQNPPDKTRVLYDAVSKDYDLGDYDTFKQKLQDPAKRKAFYDGVGQDYNLGTFDEFGKKIAPVASLVHQLNHTSVSDARFLSGQIPQYNEELSPAGYDVNAEEKQKKKQDLQNQYAGKITDISQQWNAAPSDVMKVLNDFPNENDEGKLKSNLQMLSENPKAYERFQAADANMKAIGSKDIHMANEYNHLQDVPNGTTEQLENNIAAQKDIINRTLVGEERDKALNNLAINRAPSFNALNPDIVQGASSDQNTSGLDAYQWAGLQTLKNFNPAEYERTVRFLQQDISGTEGPDAKIQLELAKKNLLDIGTKNTLNYLQEHQGILNTQFKNAQTDQEKEVLVSQWNQNKDQIQHIIDNSKTQGQRFPYLQDLEFERQAKELSGSSDEGVLSYGFHKLIGGVGKMAGSINDLAINTFGSKEAQTTNEMEAGGEAEKERNRDYLVESDRDPSLIQYKFSPELKNAADIIKKDPDLTDQQKSDKLIGLVKTNPDKVQTVTNIKNYGKTANYFSKATLYKTAGMVGELAPIIATQAGMEGAGIPKLISSITPMFLATEHDFYKEAVANGETNPAQYAYTHAAIAMAAAAADPQYKIAKNAFGASTEMGKTLSGVSEDMWNNTVSKESRVINRIKNSIGNAAKETAKAALVFGAGTDIANAAANQAIFNKPEPEGGYLRHSLNALKNTSIDFAPLIGLGAFFNIHSASPMEKGRLWDLGENSKLNLERIDNLVQNGQISSAVGEQRKSVIKSVSDLINKVPTEDSKGKPLSDQARADYLYNLIIKKNVADTKANVSEEHAKKLQDRADAAAMYNTQIAAPELSQKAVEAGLANVKLPEGNIGLKAMEGNGPALLKFIQDHVTGRSHGGDEAIGEPLKDTRNIKENFPEHLVDAAIRLIPDEEKRRITDAHDLAETEGKYKFPTELKEQLRTPKIEDNAIQEQSAGSIFQHTQSGTGIEGSERERMELGQQGEETAGTRSQEGENKGAKVILPRENKSPNVISPIKTEKIPFEDFRQEMLSQYETIKDSKWDFRITNDELSTKDREKGIKDIKEGNDTAPARKIEKHIQQMYDEGIVPMNRGRGNHAESRDFTFEELGHTRKMVNGVEKHIHDWINEEGHLTPEDTEFLHSNFDNNETYPRANGTTTEGQTAGNATGAAQPENKAVGGEISGTSGTAEPSAGGSTGSGGTDESGGVNDHPAAKLEIERDRRIAEETKPVIRNERISAGDRALSKDPEIESKYKKIQDTYNELKQIAECLWK